MQEEFRRSLLTSNWKRELQLNEANHYDENDEYSHGVLLVV